ncbi:polyprotein [Probopyrinella latreuticola Nege-like virus]|nr:polyprotein [Probopyrinella latreuticola Nege-like virus]
MSSCVEKRHDGIPSYGAFKRAFEKIDKAEGVENQALRSATHAEGVYLAAHAAFLHEVEMERDNKRSYTVRDCTTDSQREYLMRAFPNVNLIFRSDRVHEHAVAATVARIQLRDLYALIPRCLTRILDVGSNPIKIASLDRCFEVIVGLSPPVDPRDVSRRQNQIHGLRDMDIELRAAVKKNETTRRKLQFVNGVMTGERVCEDLLRDCSCKVDCYVLMHVALNMAPEELLEAMIRNDVCNAYMCYTYVPAILKATTVELKELDLVVHRKVKKIMFQYGHSPPYEHNVSDVKKWYTLPNELQHKGVTFTTEILRIQAGNVFMCIKKTGVVPVKNRYLRVDLTANLGDRILITGPEITKSNTLVGDCLLRTKAMVVPEDLYRRLRGFANTLKDVVGDPVPAKRRLAGYLNSANSSVVVNGMSIVVRFSDVDREWLIQCIILQEIAERLLSDEILEERLRKIKDRPSALRIAFDAAVGAITRLLTVDATALERWYRTFTNRAYANVTMSQVIREMEIIYNSDRLWDCRECDPCIPEFEPVEFGDSSGSEDDAPPPYVEPTAPPAKESPGHPTDEVHDDLKYQLDIGHLSKFGDVIKLPSEWGRSLKGDPHNIRSLTEYISIVRLRGNFLRNELKYHADAFGKRPMRERTLPAKAKYLKKKDLVGYEVAYDSNAGKIVPIADVGDGGWVTDDCMYFYAQHHSEVFDNWNHDVPQLTIDYVEGVPGCHKTATLLRLYNKGGNRDLMIASSKAAVEDHNKRMEKMSVKSESRTADSVMLNPAKGDYTRLLVDEANMLHWGQIVAIATLHSIRHVVMVGDPKQIPFICFLAGHQAKYHLPPVGRVVAANVSSRIGPEVASVLRAANYPEIETTNPHGRIEISYDLSNLVLRPTDDIVCMTQADKLKLLQSYPNFRGSIHTAHEVEGVTHMHRTVYIRPTAADNALYQTKGGKLNAHQVVVISRSRRDVLLVSARADDSFLNFVKHNKKNVRVVEASKITEQEMWISDLINRGPGETRKGQSHVSFSDEDTVKELDYGPVYRPRPAVTVVDEDSVRSHGNVVSSQRLLFTDFADAGNFRPQNFEIESVDGIKKYERISAPIDNVKLEAAAALLTLLKSCYSRCVAEGVNVFGVNEQALDIVAGHFEDVVFHAYDKKSMEFTRDNIIAFSGTLSVADGSVWVSTVGGLQRVKERPTIIDLSIDKNQNASGKVKDNSLVVEVVSTVRCEKLVKQRCEWSKPMYVSGGSDYLMPGRGADSVEFWTYFSGRVKRIVPCNFMGKIHMANWLRVCDCTTIGWLIDSVIAEEVGLTCLCDTNLTRRVKVFDKEESAVNFMIPAQEPGLFVNGQKKRDGQCAMWAYCIDDTYAVVNTDYHMPSEYCASDVETDGAVFKYIQEILADDQDTIDETFEDRDDGFVEDATELDRTTPVQASDSGLSLTHLTDHGQSQVSSVMDESDSDVSDDTQDGIDSGSLCSGVTDLRNSVDSTESEITYESIPSPIRGKSYNGERVKNPKWKEERVEAIDAVQSSTDSSDTAEDVSGDMCVCENLHSRRKWFKIKPREWDADAISDCSMMAVDYCPQYGAVLRDGKWLKRTPEQMWMAGVDAVRLTCQNKRRPLPFIIADATKPVVCQHTVFEETELRHWMCDCKVCRKGRKAVRFYGDWSVVITCTGPRAYTDFDVTENVVSLTTTHCVIRGTPMRRTSRPVYETTDCWAIVASKVLHKIGYKPPVATWEKIMAHLPYLEQGGMYDVRAVVNSVVAMAGVRIGWKPGKGVKCENGHWSLGNGWQPEVKKKNFDPSVLLAVLSGDCGKSYEAIIEFDVRKRTINSMQKRHTRRVPCGHTYYFTGHPGPVPSLDGPMILNEKMENTDTRWLQGDCSRSLRTAGKLPALKTQIGAGITYMAFPNDIVDDGPKLLVRTQPVVFLDEKRERLLERIDETGCISGSGDMHAKTAARVRDRLKLRKHVQPDLVHLQQAYDEILPGNSTLPAEYWPYNIAVDDLNIIMDPVKVKTSKFGEVREPKADRMIPELRTGMHVERDNGTKETMIAIAKRNQNVPTLTGTTSVRNNAAVAVNKFLQRFCADNVVDVLDLYAAEKITLSRQSMEDWLAKAEGSKINELMNEEFKHWSDQPLNLYSLSLKRQVKNIMSTAFQSQYQKMQVITALQAAVNALWSPIFKQVQSRLQYILRRNVILNVGLSDEEMADVITACVGADERRLKSLRKSFDLELDVSAMDKSHQELGHEIKNLVYRLMGVPDDLVDLWSEAHMLVRHIGHQSGISFDAKFQHKSGNSSTSIGNAILSMVAIANVMPSFEFAFALFQGDDQYIAGMSAPLNHDIALRIAKDFNIDVKVLDHRGVYFCGRMFVDMDGVWYAIPDIIKRIEKMGDMDVSDISKMKEKFESMKDLCSAYSNSAANERAGYCLMDRYRTDINLGGCMDIMYEMTRTWETFKLFMCARVGGHLVVYDKDHGVAQWKRERYGRLVFASSAKAADVVVRRGKNLDHGRFTWGNVRDCEKLMHRLDRMAEFYSACFSDAKDRVILAPEGLSVISSFEVINDISKLDYFRHKIIGVLVSDKYPRKRDVWRRMFPDFVVDVTERSVKDVINMMENGRAVVIPATMGKTTISINNSMCVDIDDYCSKVVESREKQKHVQLIEHIKRNHPRQKVLLCNTVSQARDAGLAVAGAVCLSADLIVKNTQKYSDEVAGKFVQDNIEAATIPGVRVVRSYQDVVSYVEKVLKWEIILNNRS